MLRVCLQAFETLSSKESRLQPTLRLLRCVVPPNLNTYRRFSY